MIVFSLPLLTFSQSRIGICSPAAESVAKEILDGDQENVSPWYLLDKDNDRPDHTAHNISKTSWVNHITVIKYLTCSPQSLFIIPEIVRQIGYYSCVWILGQPCAVIIYFINKLCIFSATQWWKIGSSNLGSMICKSTSSNSTGVMCVWRSKLWGEGKMSGS